MVTAVAMYGIVEEADKPNITGTILQMAT